MCFVFYAAFPSIILSAPFQQLGTAYVAATSASVLTALGFNKAIASVPALAGGVVGTS